MEAVYELALRDGGEKVVVAEESIDVGDSVAIDDEIWLVLRESDQAALMGRVRFECRRALRLCDQAKELIAYAKELELKLTRTRETRRVVLSEAENLFGEEHVRRYRETGGEIGHIWKRGSKTLLLTTRGRKTGKPTTSPLIYEQDGDNYVIVASKGGAPAHPGWYQNLVNDPNVEVQVEDDVFPARARTANGDERDRLWRLAARQWPAYDTYQTRTEREIPVVVLERA